MTTHILSRRRFLRNAAMAIPAPELVRIASGAGDEGPMPDFDGAVDWLNSAPLRSKSLRGKVVLVNFWTYSCINSLRELPYMKAWATKYKDAGLVVIGVHAPEFGFEKDPANVRNAVFDLKIAYPIPIDSRHSIWSAFRNEYWPASYFIDAKGRIRFHHFGEGEYVVSFRQRCVAVVNRTDGWSVPDVFGKQGVHVVADAVSEVVAAGTYPIQAVDQAVAVVGG